MSLRTVPLWGLAIGGVTTYTQHVSRTVRGEFEMGKESRDEQNVHVCELTAMSFEHDILES